MKTDFAAYRNLWKELAQRANAKGLPAPERATIRMETMANNAAGVYELNIKKSAGEKFNEILLGDNDAFFAIAAGVKIKREDPAKPGTGVYHTYPNSIEFPDVASEVNNRDLESIFNSRLNITIGQMQIVEGVDLSKCRVVAGIQQSIAGNHSETASDGGLLHLGHVVRLGGSESVAAKLITKSYTGKLVQYVADAKKVIIAVELDGFIIRGGSKLGSIQLDW